MDASSVFNSATTLAAVIVNRPPVCSTLTSDTFIWPPNGKFVSIDVAQHAGVVDPDNEDVTIAIQAITQDEPVRGAGDRSAPDARGLGEATAELRAEPRGNGNGRVYAIEYRASDAGGASCDGVLLVGAPHDNGSGAAIDDGQNFNSTEE